MVQVDLGHRIDGKWNVWRKWAENQPWILIQVVRVKEQAESMCKRLTWHYNKR